MERYCFSAHGHFIENLFRDRSVINHQRKSPSLHLYPSLPLSSSNNMGTYEMIRITWTWTKLWGGRGQRLTRCSRQRTRDTTADSNRGFQKCGSHGPCTRGENAGEQQQQRGQVYSAGGSCSRGARYAAQRAGPPCHRRQHRPSSPLPRRALRAAAT